MSVPKPEEATSTEVAAETPPAKGAEPFTKLDLDTLLVKEIGDFGRFQIRSLGIGMILVFFTAIANASYIFTTGISNTRCLIAECESKPTPYVVPWLMNAIPPKEKKHDLCNRYALKPGAPKKRPPKGTCPAEWFDKKTKIPCEEYVYEDTYSVVYDFKLECREWWRTFLGSVRKLGTLTALPVTSYISDRWGRRIAMVFNAVNTAAIGVQRYWINSYWAYLILDFLEGTFGSGLFSCAWVLMVEVFGPRFRVAAGAAINTSYSIGQMTLGAAAWVVPHWKPLTLLLYVPQFTSIFAYWTITESVRWYMAKGMFEQSEDLLRKMARVNGRSVKDVSLANMRRTAIEAQEKAVRRAELVGAGPGLVAQILSHKRVLLRVLVSPVWWITTTLIYHGLAINATTVSGNRYQNYILVSMIEIPGFWVAYYFLDRVGRKPVLSCGYWVCAVCLFSYIFIPAAFQLPIYMLAKCSIAMVITSVYCYTAELYPTTNRHKLLALASSFGLVGSITAPLTPALAAKFFSGLPFLLFSVMAATSGMLIFLTPETLGTVLPDNFDQAERLRRREPAAK